MRSLIALIAALAICANVALASETTPRVLVAVLVSDAFSELPFLIESLRALDYPKNKLSIAFLESDSNDDGMTELWFDMHAKTLRSEFARFEVHRLDFDLNTDVVSNSATEEIARLSTLARRRNTLLSLAMRDTDDFVLWTDVRARLPSDTIRAFVASQGDIVSPNVVSSTDGSTVNRRSWRQVDRDAEAEAALDESAPVLLTGFNTAGAVDASRRDLSTLRSDADLSRSAIVPLSSVSGEVLWVRSEVFRVGALFPASPYKRLLESEGFARLAADLGYTAIGMPNLEVPYDVLVASSRSANSIWQFSSRLITFAQNNTNNTNNTTPAPTPAPTPPTTPTPPATPQPTPKNPPPPFNGTNSTTPVPTFTFTGTGTSTPGPRPPPVCKPSCLFGKCVYDGFGGPYCKCPNKRDYKQPRCYPCPGIFDPELADGACSGRSECFYSHEFHVAYCPNCTKGYAGVACQAKLGPGTIIVTALPGVPTAHDLGSLAQPPNNYFGMSMQFTNGFSYPVAFVMQGANADGATDPNSNPPPGSEGLTGVGLTIDMTTLLNIRLTQIDATPLTIILNMAAAPLIPGVPIQLLLFNPYLGEWRPPCNPPFDVCTLANPETLDYECLICHFTQFNSFAPAGSTGGRAPLGPVGSGNPPPGPITPPPFRTVFPPGTSSDASALASSSALGALVAVAIGVASLLLLA